MMGHRSESATPDNSDEESGDAFTDGDFEDSDDDTLVERNDHSPAAVAEARNEDVQNKLTNGSCAGNSTLETKVNGHTNSSENNSSDVDSGSGTEARRDSHGDQNPSIVGILGDQHCHAEQRLAARRAARAEAREIRMRELERQQREQEDHADKAYDMYTESVGRRGGTRLASLGPAAAALSPRRSSEDSNDDAFNIKDLRHELKEVEEKFRKAMILNAQLDNDKAALGYQLELLKDRLEELQEDHAQLTREHREKCSSLERTRRSLASAEREVELGRAALRARGAAAERAGLVFVEAGGAAPGALVPPLALVSAAAHQLLADAGEGTLDVRLEKLASSKQALESEVRKLKLQLNEERAARQNGVANHHDDEYENELESVRRAVTEAKGRAARAEAEAALQAAAAARLEAQVARFRAKADLHDAAEEQLKSERRRLQREAREALNRVEELETENSHLTKRLDKLKNAKSALLKDL